MPSEGKLAISGAWWKGNDFLAARKEESTRCNPWMGLADAWLRADYFLFPASRASVAAIFWMRRFSDGSTGKLRWCGQSASRMSR